MLAITTACSTDQISGFPFNKISDCELWLLLQAHTPNKPYLLNIRSRTPRALSICKKKPVCVSGMSSGKMERCSVTGLVNNGRLDSEEKMRQACEAG